MRNGAASQRRGQAIQVTSDGVRGLRDLTPDLLRVLLQHVHREYAGRFPRGRARQMPDGVKIVRSTDLPLVSFWMMNGVALIDFEVDNSGRYPRATYILADYEGSIERLTREYPSSEAARFDSTVRGLKKLSRG